MRRIGITQRLLETREYIETREALDIRWGELFYHLSWVMIPLSYAMPLEVYVKEFALEGVILSGGNDLNDFVSSPLNKKRDAYEKEILRYAKQHAFPLLGVCRGAQMIAYEGGSLLEFCEGHVGRHEIFWEEGGDEIIGSEHQLAIRELGAGLIPLARSCEGLVEAFRGEEAPLFGMMWHPERQDKRSAGTLKMVELFSQALQKRD